MTINNNFAELQIKNIICELIERNNSCDASLACLHILSLPLQEQPTWWHRADERIKTILCAADHNVPSVARLLIKSPISEERIFPLYSAICNGSAETIQKLLRISALLFPATALDQTTVQIIQENFAQNWSRKITNKETLQAIASYPHISGKYFQCLFQNNMLAEAITLYDAIDKVPDEQKPAEWGSATDHSKFFIATATAGTPCEAALKYCDIHYQPTPLKKSAFMWALQLHLQLPLMRIIKPTIWPSSCNLSAKDATKKTAAQYLVESIDDTTLSELITEWNPSRRNETTDLIAALLRTKKFKHLDALLPKFYPTGIDCETKSATLFCLAAEHEYSTKAFEQLNFSSSKELRNIDPEMNVWYRDAAGNGPLHFAIKNKRIDLVLRFLKYGAPLSSKNKEGISVAQELLSTFDQTTISRLLIDLNVQNTPHYLHCLIDLGRKAEALAILNPILEGKSTPAWWNSIYNRTTVYITLLEANESQIALSVKAAGIDLNAPSLHSPYSRLEIAVRLQKDPKRAALLIHEGSLARPGLLFAMHCTFGNSFIQYMSTTWDFSRPDTLDFLQSEPYDIPLLSNIEQSLDHLIKITESGTPNFVLLLNQRKAEFPHAFFTSIIDTMPFTPDTVLILTSLYTHGHRELGQRLLHRLMEWTPSLGRGLWWNKKAQSSVFFAILKSMQQRKLEESHLHDLLLLTPYIDHEATTTEGHTPLFEALYTQNETLISLLIINGSKLSSIVNGHSLFYHLQMHMGEKFALSLLNNISLENSPSLSALVPLLIQDNLLDAAQKLFTHIFQNGTKTLKTELFFSIARSSWTKKVDALLSLLPSLEYTQKEENSGQTVLMCAIANQLPYTALLHIAEKNLRQNILERDVMGKSTLQYLIENNSVLLEKVFISQYPLDDATIVDEIGALFDAHAIDQAHALLIRLLELPIENVPSWWNSKAKTALFFKEANAVASRQNRICSHDLMVLACDLEPSTLDKALLYAVQNNELELAYTLIMQGAPLFALEEGLSVFHYFLQKFGKTKTTELLESLRFDDADTIIKLIPVLIQEGYSQEAQIVYNRFDALYAKPSWWTSKAKTQFFFALVEKKPVAQQAIAIIQQLLTLYPSFNLSERDSKNDHRTVLQAAAQQQLPPNIVSALLDISKEHHLLETNDKNETTLQLLLLHSTIDPYHCNILTFFKKCNFFEEDLGEIIEEAELSNTHKGQALIDYVTTNNSLLNAILKPQIQRTKSTNTDLFFQIASSDISQEGKDALLSKIITSLDITKREKGSPHRTVLHAIAKYRLNPHYVDLLLYSEEQFFEKTDLNKSVLRSLLMTNSIRLDNPILKRFLKTLRIPEMRSQKELWHYLCSKKGFWNAIGTLASKIVVAYLIHHTKKFNALCAICVKNPQLRDEVLRDLPQMGGKTIEAMVLDASFTMNRAHLVLPAPVIIPEKASHLRVSIISTLYKQYTDDPTQKKAENLSSLHVFEKRFEERAFFGGPASETNLYKNIDNASCAVAFYFQERIAKLEKDNQGRKIMQLVAAEDVAAKELVSDMRVWFQECIAASEMCAPRIYNNAITNYLKYVLRKKTDTFKEKLYDILAEKRAEVISGLFDESQSVHAANQFLHDYAREFAIPGYEIYIALVDIWGTAHKAEVDAAKISFIRMYPHLAVDAVRDALMASREFYEKFLDFLKEKAGPQAEQQALQAFIKEVAIIWYTGKTPEEKEEKITRFLQRHALVINDTSSLQSIEQELTAMADEQAKTLYLSRVQELKNDNKMHFSTESIVSVLTTLKVLA